MYRLPKLDSYAPLAHKELVGDGTTKRSDLNVAPTWVSDEDQRRLAAYYIRASYIGNVARNTLPASVTDAKRKDHREYGDAALAVDRIAAGVLGDDWSIVVEGADANLTDIELPERPPAASEGADELEVRLADLRLDQWRQEAEELLDRWTSSAEALPGLQQRQEDIRGWGDKVQMSARFDEGERNAQGLGDAIHVLWPQAGDWPKYTVEDPGVYFPDLPDDGSTIDFPDGVHLAWEYESKNPDGSTTRFLRRITFELVEIIDTYVGVGGDGVVWVDADGNETTGAPLRADERLIDGRIHRWRPWYSEAIGQGPPPEEWSTVTCLMSDGTWDLSTTSAFSDLADLSDAAATWAEASDGRPVRRLDIGSTFIPIIHEPNTSDSKEHFGRSAIDQAAQVLDDLAAADTDIVRASKFIGAPTISLFGATGAGVPVLTPGVILEGGKEGRMDVLDLSGGLEKLRDYADALGDRFWSNIKVPSEVVGRTEDQAVAGITLVMRWGPFKQVVTSTRAARQQKKRLFFKHVQRMAQLAGALPPGEIPDVRVAWGAFMPQDRADAMLQVGRGLEAGAISTQTAVTMLVEAGLPIDDATAEVDRIRADDTTGAREVADAVGVGGVAGERAAAARLGIEIDTTGTAAPAPVIDLPPVPPAE